ncbi:hypothetical protein GCM10023085_69680 [Actinomadura viridis]|uniref:Asparagine synthase n=1 Tax=Actinomadura viridis TaxID=58110 RepID=A0A931DK34_9ACTN|nr:hypothetical protein [Actinomadura viridis]MBG6090174.1 hypothetical protein [Actinomadura viridis]
MRAYLAIAVSDPGETVPPHVLDAARAAITDAVPAPRESWRTAEWISPDRAVALLAWSNEPAAAPFPDPLTTSGDRVLGYCGYLGGPDDPGALLDAGDPGETADGLGGCFSAFRAGPRGFTAVTSITRACPVYHAEAAGLRFAASRALLAHLAVALPVGWRMSEEPVAMLTRMFAPGLRDVPLQGGRWRYERRRPAGIADWAGWRRRATPRAHRAPGFNWRRSYDRGMAGLLREQIMAAPPELFDLLNETAVRERLAEVPPRRPGQSWALLTLSVLLSGAWREPEPVLPEVTVPRPS